MSGDGGRAVRCRRELGRTDEAPVALGDHALRLVDRLVPLVVGRHYPLLNPSVAGLRLGCLVDLPNDEALLARWQRPERFGDPFSPERPHEVVRDLNACAVKDRDLNSNAVVGLRPGLAADSGLDPDEVPAAPDREKAHLERLRLVHAGHDEDRALGPQRLGDLGGDRDGAVVHPFGPVLQACLERELLSYGGGVLHGLGGS